MNDQTDYVNIQSRGKNSSLDDRGPCDREGDRACIGDISYVCTNSRWKSTHEYCQDDNTTT